MLRSSRCAHIFRVVDSVSAVAIEEGTSKKYVDTFEMGDEFNLAVIKVRRLKCLNLGCKNLKITVEISRRDFERILEDLRELAEIRDTGKEQAATMKKLKAENRRLRTRLVRRED